MKLSSIQNVKTAVKDETRAALLNTLEEEFKKISLSVIPLNGNLQATSINASFGSILRQDVTMLSVTENNNKDGYIINCDTDFKPSTAFWIFCVIDLLLAVTVIGLFIGLGITLGLYFYNKSLVEKAVKSALDNVKNSME